MGVADSGTLHHTCFVVNDLEKSAKALAESLSVKWNLWTIEPTDTTVHGREVPFSFRVAIAQVGDSNYELIAPHSGQSIYAEHLKSYEYTCCN